MDLTMAIRIAELALQLAAKAAGGTKVGETINEISALEEIAGTVARQYQALAGKPLDLSLLTYEEPIP